MIRRDKNNHLYLPSRVLSQPLSPGAQERLVQLIQEFEKEERGHFLREHYTLAEVRHWLPEVTVETHPRLLRTTEQGLVKGVKEYQRQLPSIYLGDLGAFAYSTVAVQPIRESVGQLPFITSSKERVKAYAEDVTREYGDFVYRDSREGLEERLRSWIAPKH